MSNRGPTHDNLDQEAPIRPVRFSSTTGMKRGLVTPIWPGSGVSAPMPGHRGFRGLVSLPTFSLLSALDWGKPPTLPNKIRAAEVGGHAGRPRPGGHPRRRHQAEAAPPPPESVASHVDVRRSASERHRVAAAAGAAAAVRARSTQHAAVARESSLSAEPAPRKLSVPVPYIYPPFQRPVRCRLCTLTPLSRRCT